MKDNNIKLEIITRQLRMLYYNDYLLKHGVITKREHDKMNIAIISKHGAKKRNNLNTI